MLIMASEMAGIHSPVEEHFHDEEQLLLNRLFLLRMVELVVLSVLMSGFVLVVHVVLLDGFVLVLVLAVLLGGFVLVLVHVVLLDAFVLVLVHAVLLDGFVLVVHAEAVEQDRIRVAVANKDIGVTADLVE